MKKITIVAPIVVGFLVAACLPQEPRVESPFKPVATVQDIMLSIIDPNIDYVWNAVSTVATTTGIEEKSPQTNEEWQAVKRHALVVLEASNLLIIDGRPVAHAGGNTSSGGAELSAEAIQQLIDGQRAEFNVRALKLNAAMQQVIAAIDKKNVEEFEQAGGLVEQACEQCHTQFWYPNDQRPK